MKLNAVERVLMNNPARSASQQLYESRVLERLGGRVPNGRVLEVGCGRGVGVDIIFTRFGAASVDAFDLDPEMVAKARRRLSAYGSDRVRLFVGDAIAIDASDASYDAVFDFGTIHHVPKWRDAVAEIGRVLKPGGKFYFEEVTSHALARWSYRTFLDHPTADRFSGPQFIAEVEDHGITVRGNYVERFFTDFVVGVGTKAA
jgi:ubiquinone/menaquinone biosynthesis C-methylase UbiE